MNDAYGLQSVTAQLIEDATTVRPWLLRAVQDILAKDGEIDAVERAAHPPERVVETLIAKVASRQAMLSLFWRSGDKEPSALTVLELWSDYFGTRFAVVVFGWSRVQGTNEEKADVLRWNESMARQAGVQEIRTMTRRHARVYERWIRPHGYKRIMNMAVVFRKELI